MAEVTRLLAEIEAGDLQSAEKLLPLVYEKLRKLAAARLAKEKSGTSFAMIADLGHATYED